MLPHTRLDAACLGSVPVNGTTAMQPVVGPQSNKATVKAVRAELEHNEGHPVATARGSGPVRCESRPTQLISVRPLFATSPGPRMRLEGPSALSLVRHLASERPGWPRKIQGRI